MSRIRVASEGDLPALRAIQSATLVEPWPELLETAVAAGATLVVTADGTVAGYAIVLGSEPEPAYVPEFAVDPAHQGAGYGSRLMAALLDRLAAHGHPAVRLTVLADDDRATAFYRAHGFEIVERRPDEFAAGAGLLLTRDLGSTGQSDR